MDQHEYALLGGINRAKIGHFLTTLSASVSAFLVYLVLSAVDIAKNLGWNVNVPPSILSLLGAGAVYLVLYAIFAKHLWRLPPVRNYLKVPDLDGDWLCEGQQFDQFGALGDKWSGTVTIRQSWDKFRVRLRTATSTSDSMTAAVLFDDIDGFVLLYSYANTPNPDHPDFQGHRGFATIRFNKDQTSGEGNYFNGYGRFTAGNIVLRRQ